MPRQTEAAGCSGYISIPCTMKFVVLICALSLALPCSLCEVGQRRKLRSDNPRDNLLVSSAKAFSTYGALDRRWLQAAAGTSSSARVLVAADSATYSVVGLSQALESLTLQVDYSTDLSAAVWKLSRTYYEVIIFPELVAYKEYDDLYDSLVTFLYDGGAVVLGPSPAFINVTVAFTQNIISRTSKYGDAGAAVMVDCGASAVQVYSTLSQSALWDVSTTPTPGSWPTSLGSAYGAEPTGYAAACGPLSAANGTAMYVDPYLLAPAVFSYARGPGRYYYVGLDFDNDPRDGTWGQLLAAIAAQAASNPTPGASSPPPPAVTAPEESGLYDTLNDTSTIVPWYVGRGRVSYTSTGPTATAALTSPPTASYGRSSTLCYYLPVSSWATSTSTSTTTSSDTTSSSDGTSSNTSTTVNSDGVSSGIAVGAWLALDLGTPRRVSEIRIQTLEACSFNESTVSGVVIRLEVRVGSTMPSAATDPSSVNTPLCPGPSPPTIVTGRTAVSGSAAVSLTCGANGTLVGRYVTVALLDPLPDAAWARLCGVDVVSSIPASYALVSRNKPVCVTGYRDATSNVPAELDPSLAVDGLYGDNRYTSGTCGLSMLRQDPFLTLDLGGAMNIERVEVTKSWVAAYSQQLADFSILVSNMSCAQLDNPLSNAVAGAAAVCGSGLNLPPGTTGVFNCSGTVGRYVTIAMQNYYGYLRLCEIDVFASLPSTSSTSSNTTSNTTSSSTPTSYLVSVHKRLTVGTATALDSLFSGQAAAGTNKSVAAYLVDGVTPASLRAALILSSGSTSSSPVSYSSSLSGSLSSALGVSCVTATATGDPAASPWLALALGGTYLVHYVQLHFSDHFETLSYSGTYKFDLDVRLGSTALTPDTSAPGDDHPACAAAAGGLFTGLEDFADLYGSGLNVRRYRCGYTGSVVVVAGMRSTADGNGTLALPPLCEVEVYATAVDGKPVGYLASLARYAAISDGAGGATPSTASRALRNPNTLQSALVPEEERCVVAPAPPGGWAFWAVDLGRVLTITRIEIYSTDYLDLTTTVNVTVTNDTSSFTPTPTSTSTFSSNTSAARSTTYLASSPGSGIPYPGGTSLILLPGGGFRAPRTSTTTTNTTTATNVARALVISNTVANASLRLCQVWVYSAEQAGAGGAAGARAGVRVRRVSGRVVQAVGSLPLDAQFVPSHRHRRSLQGAVGGATNEVGGVVLAGGGRGEPRSGGGSQLHDSSHGKPGSGGVAASNDGGGGSVAESGLQHYQQRRTSSTSSTSSRNALSGAVGDPSVGGDSGGTSHGGPHQHRRRLRQSVSSSSTTTATSTTTGNTSLVLDLGLPRPVEEAVLVVAVAGSTVLTSTNTYVTTYLDLDGVVISVSNDTSSAPGAYCAYDVTITLSMTRHVYGCGGAYGRYVVVARTVSYALPPDTSLEVYLEDPGTQVLASSLRPTSQAGGAVSGPGGGDNAVNGLYDMASVAAANTAANAAALLSNPTADTTRTTGGLTYGSANTSYYYFGSATAVVAGPWWAVDLGAAVPLVAVEVTAHPAAADGRGLESFEIALANTTVTSGTEGLTVFSGLNLTAGTTGRYLLGGTAARQVIVRQPASVTRSMELAQADVYADATALSTAASAGGANDLLASSKPMSYPYVYDMMRTTGSYLDASSTWQYGELASLAVDGSADTGPGRCATAGPSTATDAGQQQQNPWLLLDLGSDAVQVDRVDLLKSADPGVAAQLEGVDVLLGNTTALESSPVVLSNLSLPHLGAWSSFLLDPPAVGRYLGVVRREVGSALTLCELAAYGPSPFEMKLLTTPSSPPPPPSPTPPSPLPPSPSQSPSPPPPLPPSPSPSPLLPPSPDTSASLPPPLPSSSEPPLAPSHPGPSTTKQENSSSRASSVSYPTAVTAATASVVTVSVAAAVTATMVASAAAGSAAGGAAAMAAAAAGGATSSSTGAAAAAGSVGTGAALAFVGHMQFFALTSHAAVDNANTTYDASNSQLSWLNLEFNLLRQTNLPPAQQTAYSQIINICIVYGAVLVLHILLVLALRAVRHLSSGADEDAGATSFSLPSFLVFPFPELFIVIFFITSLASAAGTLVGAGAATDGGGAAGGGAVAVGVVLLVLLAAFAALVLRVLLRLYVAADRLGVSYVPAPRPPPPPEAGEGRLARWMRQAERGFWQRPEAVRQLEPHRTEVYLAKGFSLLEAARATDPNHRPDPALVSHALINNPLRGRGGSGKLAGQGSNPMPTKAASGSDGGKGSGKADLVGAKTAAARPNRGSLTNAAVGLDEAAVVPVDSVPRGPPGAAWASFVGDVSCGGGGQAMTAKDEEQGAAAGGAAQESTVGTGPAKQHRLGQPQQPQPVAESIVRATSDPAAASAAATGAVTVATGSGPRKSPSGPVQAALGGRSSSSGGAATTAGSGGGPAGGSSSLPVASERVRRSEPGTNQRPQSPQQYQQQHQQHVPQAPPLTTQHPTHLNFQMRLQVGRYPCGSGSDGVAPRARHTVDGSAFAAPPSQGPLPAPPPPRPPLPADGSGSVPVGRTTSRNSEPGHSRPGGSGGAGGLPAALEPVYGDDRDVRRTSSGGGVGASGLAPLPPRAPSGGSTRPAGRVSTGSLGIRHPTSLGIGAVPAAAGVAAGAAAAAAAAAVDEAGMAPRGHPLGAPTGIRDEAQLLPGILPPSEEAPANNPEAAAATRPGGRISSSGRDGSSGVGGQGKDPQGGTGTFTASGTTASSSSSLSPPAASWSRGAAVGAAPSKPGTGKDGAAAGGGSGSQEGDKEGKKTKSQSGVRVEVTATATVASGMAVREQQQQQHQQQQPPGEKDDKADEEVLLAEVKRVEVYERYGQLFEEMRGRRLPLFTFQAALVFNAVVPAVLLGAQAGGAMAPHSAAARGTNVALLAAKGLFAVYLTVVMPYTHVVTLGAELLCAWLEVAVCCCLVALQWADRSAGISAAMVGCEVAVFVLQYIRILLTTVLPVLPLALGWLKAKCCGACCCSPSSTPPPAPPPPAAAGGTTPRRPVPAFSLDVRVAVGSPRALSQANVASFGDALSPPAQPPLPPPPAPARP